MRVIEFVVKGVTFDGRQETIKRLTGREPVRIFPEPENKFDANALAVKCVYDGEIRHVGYVPKEMASTIAPELEGETLDGEIIRITGGYQQRDGSTASFGLWVRFEFPDRSL